MINTNINEIETQATQTYHMVVIGDITERTKTHLTVRYPALSSDKTLVINRSEMGASGSTGIIQQDLNQQSSIRAFSFKRALCPTCEGNNDGDSKKRQRITEVDESGNQNITIHKCPTCDGKGTLTSFPADMTPSIEPEWADIVGDLELGYAPSHMQPTFASAFAGKRGGKMDDWNVEIVSKPLMALTPTGVAKPVNPPIYQHFNEQYASEEHPHGLQIGRTKTDSYYTMQHHEALQPYIDLCDKLDLPYTTYGANYGCDAYMDIMLAENGTKKEIMDALRIAKTDGVEGNYDFGGSNSVTKNPAGVIKFGVQIHHSFDGSLSMRGICERVACLNGMISEETLDILSIMHKGNMAKMDLGNLAEMVLKAAIEMWKEMSYVEGMNNINLNDNDFEKLLVVLEERKIIIYPRLGQKGNLIGGQTFRNATQGWSDPTQEWVAVGGEHDGEVNSLYHAYNIISGIHTWRPAVADAHGSIGAGNKAIGQDRTHSQMAKGHKVFRELQDSAVEAFEATHGHTPNAQEINEYVEANGIPMLNAIQPTEAGHYLPELLSVVGDDGNYAEAQLTIGYSPKEMIK